ncbi:MAG: M28 family peptidase [SAR86 cluster bacterium]|uniref:M28 family peptidase n=1 Tax=SAR86 cluster bacterium TaxID=2030880 RepID=A0A520MB37_9GAMM|nr:MAG: M28 family peptidase [SAR86 cluster bacterium]
MTKKHFLTYIFLTTLLISCSSNRDEAMPLTMEETIKILASDEYEGRAPGSEGGKLTKNFISKTFKNYGLLPVDKSYFLEVPAVNIDLSPNSFFSISFRNSDENLEPGKDVVFWTKRTTDYEKIRSSDLIFVGYGIVAPEYNWNDYDGIDVKGKTVVMLINDPGFASGSPRLFNGRAMTYYGRWTYKFEEAARQGAAAAIIVHDEEPASYPWSVVESSWSGPQLSLQRSNNDSQPIQLESWIHKDKLNELLKYSGFNLESLQEIALSKTFKPFNLRGLQLNSDIYNQVNYFTSHNIGAIKKGSKYPDEYILFTAHWDHIGINNNIKDGSDNIYNGAVDNATGVAALLELSKRFSLKETDRSILFLSVTLEESGLLGSEYFANNSPIPLRNIVAGFNFDAIHPSGLSNDMVVIGYGASELEDLLELELIKQNRYVNPDPTPEKGFFYRSDHISFAKRGVPMLYSNNGSDLVEGGRDKAFNLAYDYTANHYHQPSDEYNKNWDMDGIEQTVNTIFNISNDLANSTDWPNWYEGNEFKAIRDRQRSN